MLGFCCSIIFVRFRSSTFESFYFYHALWLGVVVLYGVSPHPGGFFVVEIYFILGPQHGLRSRIASTLNFWYSSLDVWAWFSKPSLFPSAFPGLPLFAILIFGGFPGVFYFEWSGVAFCLRSSFRPHFLVDLVQSFFYFFGIFSFQDLPSYVFGYFFSIIWVAGVCFWRCSKVL